MKLFKSQYLESLVCSLLLMTAFPHTSLAAAEVRDCSDWTTKAESCKQIPCVGKFKNHIGVWDGKYEVFDNSREARIKEVRVVFSTKACFITADESESYLVGRQTEYYPKHKDEPSKTQKLLLVYGQRLADNKSFLRIIDFRGLRQDYILAKDEVDTNTWVRNENNKKLELIETRLAQSTKWEVELKVSEPGTDRSVASEEVLMKGYKKALAVGETSYFAGEAWTYKADGTLIRSGRTLVERRHDPSEGKIYQHEVRLPASVGQGNGTEVLTQYEVTADVPGISKSWQKGEANVSGGGHVENVEVVTPEGVFSEQKLFSENGKAIQVELRSGFAVPKEEFEKEYKKVQKTIPSSRPGH